MGTNQFHQNRIDQISSASCSPCLDVVVVVVVVVLILRVALDKNCNPSTLTFYSFSSSSAF